MEEISRQLVGAWTLDRSENFENALKEMGRSQWSVLQCKHAGFKGHLSGVNVVFRKLATHAKPSMEIQVEDNKVAIVAKAAFFTKTLTCPLDEPYEQEYDGIKMKCMTTWVDNKLITEANPVEPDKHKPQKFHRERVNDELIQTMWIGDVKCTRIFKPAPA